MRGFIAAAVVALWAALAAPQASAQSVAADSRVFELRTYTAPPGKLEALHKRFREHTLSIFKKHGMTSLGYWVPTDKPNTLVYLLAFPSREARDKAWAAFREDPEWKQVAADSTRDGPITEKIESVLMLASDYSPMK